MAPFLCSICQDLHRLDKLRSLPCGHTFCGKCIQGCIEITTRRPDQNGVRPALPRQPTCPSCRKVFKRTDPHPIYLDSGDSSSQPSGEAARPPCHSDAVHQRIQTATREINVTERDLRPQTVQKAALEMEKVVELSDGQQECLLGLLAAVAERWRGMLPVLSTVANQRNELLALQDQLRQTKLAKEAAEKATSRAEKIATNAVNTAGDVHNALEKAKAEIKTLQGDAESARKAHNEEMAEKQKKIKWLYDSVQAFKKQETKQKAEIERLKEEAREQARLLEAAESQVVDLEVEEDGAISESLVIQPGGSQAYDWSGSQATFERLPTTVRKRKGSEDELAFLDAELEPSDYDEPAPAPEARKRVLRPMAVKAPVFSSDWQLPPAQVKQQKGKQRPLQRSTSATMYNPLALDPHGRPLKPVHVGSRKRMRGDS